VFLNSPYRATPKNALKKGLQKKFFKKRSSKKIGGWVWDVKNVRGGPSKKNWRPLACPTTARGGGGGSYLTGRLCCCAAPSAPYLPGFRASGARAPRPKPRLPEKVGTPLRKAAPASCGAVAAPRPWGTGGEGLDEVARRALLALV
jgi:hypothetical protein